MPVFQTFLRSSLPYPIAIEGIPWWLQILHIEQEVAESDQTALDMVLETDEERLMLLQEQTWLEAELAREVRCSAERDMRSSVASMDKAHIRLSPISHLGRR